MPLVAWFFLILWVIVYTVFMLRQALKWHRKYWDVHTVLAKVEVWAQQQCDCLGRFGCEHVPCGDEVLEILRGKS